MDLLKEPSRGTSGHGGVESKFVLLKRKAILDRCSQPKAASKFVGQYRTHIRVAFVDELDAKELLEESSVGT
jgi:hypothetical protein